MPEPVAEGPFTVGFYVEVDGWGKERDKQEVAYRVAKSLVDKLCSGESQDSVRVWRLYGLASKYSSSGTLMVHRTAAQPVFYDMFVDDGHHPGRIPWWEPAVAGAASTPSRSDFTHPHEQNPSINGEVNSQLVGDESAGQNPPKDT